VNQSASLMVRRAAEGELDLVRDLLRLAYRPYADDMPGELYHHYVADLLRRSRPAATPTFWTAAPAVAGVDMCARSVRRRTVVPSAARRAVL
jgi:hypothetical protein